MTQSKKKLDEHYEEFKEQGYTLFEGVYNPEDIALLKKTYHRLHESVSGTAFDTWWFANTCELAPTQMLPAVANPLILDFAELVLGPFVQLDNLSLAGFPSTSQTEAQGKVNGWHRDRWATYPMTEDYVSPLSINAISYLQELTNEYGPLRVIPGSHRQKIDINKEDRSRPHKEEQILHLKAGDVAVTHNGLIHSGTPNTSGDTRYFFSVYYNKSWLKPTDNHNGPNVQRIIKEARSRNDHRLLRLFGVDEQLDVRANSGFLDADEQLWAQWAAADKAAVKIGN
ncbi:phytanoyl-CoA dioxygenase family protein [Cohnella sp. WQ 127256]|uniref:phytanoyl-CoA dioxygenase family protein n=1 Tax=Cohnella sp. WQ 127256 TaxID=2938790 RepID=UPI002118CAD5|nr:phytanoyl-CoA dioxygenase family protein [Cohnella sp. WQ 127256]